MNPIKYFLRRLTVLPPPVPALPWHPSCSAVSALATLRPSLVKFSVQTRPCLKRTRPPFPQPSSFSGGLPPNHIKSRRVCRREMSPFISPFHRGETKAGRCRAAHCRGTRLLLSELLATGTVSRLFFLLSSPKLYLENIYGLQWWQVPCCG